MRLLVRRDFFSIPPFLSAFFLFRCDDELKGKLPLFRVAKVCMYVSEHCNTGKICRIDTDKQLARYNSLIYISLN